MSPEDCRTLQHDTLSGRAAEAVPKLAVLLGDDPDPLTQKAVGLLKEWDCRMDAESAAAAVFHLFFHHWSRAVLAERLPTDQIEFAAMLAGGVASRLLHGDAAGWFVKQDRTAAVRTAFHRALADLTERQGPDPSGWSWGRLHMLVQKHFLSGRGDLGQLLDRSGSPVSGDGTTVFSGTGDANHQAYLGAGYRMVADLSDPAAGLWAIEVGGASGHPGSPHYDDQLKPWLTGVYHYTPLVDGP